MKCACKMEDVDKPHKVFKGIINEGKKAVLLESGGPRGWSFVGIVNSKVRVPEGEDGLFFMRDFLRRRGSKKMCGALTRPARQAGMPRHHNAPPFTCGFAGFLSYDLGAKWVAGPEKNYAAAPSVPNAYFVYVDKVIAFRNNAAEFNARRIVPQFCDAPTAQKTPALKSNITRAQYFQKIREIKKYLYSGDTYQVNFSQRFKTQYKGPAFDLYEKLTALNPSPAQFFMETPRFAVISNSPERLFKIRGRAIETNPIKGTAPRGRNSKEIARNIKKLLASEKEAAELAMIVDLERNDLGKICAPGTVRVIANRRVEKYSHVIHTVADIQGVLENDKDWLDALYALFPGGSITGCPKKRTVEIISKLEGHPRGVYCGSAGYIDISGNCDFNIMIRTLWLDKKKNKLVFHSGGGVVVDSSPEKEYEETMHKAQAIKNAIRETW